MDREIDRSQRPVPRIPADFDAFWQQALAELAGVDPDVRPEAQAVQGPHGLVLQWSSFRSLGDVRIHFYSITSQSKRVRPTLVHSHGYGSQCEPRWDWAAAGADVFGVDIRGCGRSDGALPRASRWGYIMSGIESPETSVLRGAVCDYIRLAQIARQRAQSSDQRVVLHGVSFAGGLALMAEALLHIADALVIGVPTFGWAEGRYFLSQAGSGGELQTYLSARPESTEDVMVVLSYFDSVTFASRVTCPTLIGLGLRDEVVPPETVYAIANHIPSTIEIMEFPVSHSELPEEALWARFDDRCVEIALEGQNAEA